MDCSPPGSSIHGIFQARVLEWGAIADLKRYPPKYLGVAEWREECGERKEGREIKENRKKRKRKSWDSVGNKT